MPRNTKPLQDLNKQIERFSEFDTERLIKRPEWGEIDLEEARIDIDRVCDIVNYFGILPTDILTADALTKIHAELNGINELFNQINLFSISSSGNPGNQRNQFVQQIQAQADSFYTQASPWIPFLAYQKGDVAQNIDSLTKAVTEANNLIIKAEGDIEAKGEEITKIIEAAREASAAAGAAVFTKDFQEESKTKSDAAKGWLKMTALMGFATLISAWVFWGTAKAGLDSGHAWQLISTKIVILGVMATGTIWCGRIYKALMHQAAIYRQRSLSIQTLQAFSAAVANPTMKDAVVMEAARAIFGNTATGYIDSHPTGSEGDVKLFEIAKNLIPNKG
jgi:hypothetical protein